VNHRATNHVTPHTYPISLAMHVDDSLSARSTSTTLSAEPIVSRLPPLHLRLAYFISLWSFKAFFQLGLSAGRLLPRRRKDLLQPEVKAYEVRPDLKNRIFRPQDSEEEELPLYLDVHGGGWAVADPETDDEFCSFLAQNFSIIVISVDYHKSPTHKFPRAVEDVAAISQAVMDDGSLNIDKNKVVLGGFSAGGNLAFAAAQTEGLRGRLSALVGFYPVLDLTEPLEAKLSRRPRSGPSDILVSSAHFLDWAYVPAGTDRRDPLLSPRWANPKNLPSYAYLVGAEYDMLCYEARQMAESLSKYTAMDCERTSIPTLPEGDGWQQGGVRWECARGRQHAFTHIAKHGRRERDRVKYCQEMYSRVGCWLNEEVWARPSIP
jgi:acetyl esterase/lipase